MPMKMTYHLRGMEAFDATIRKLKAPQNKVIFRNALTRQGDDVKDRSRDAYLRGQALRYITGTLWSSIELDTRKLPLSVKVGSFLPQSGPLHFGWPAKNIRPHPFLFPAVEDRLPDHPKIWAEEIRKVLGVGEIIG